MKQIGVFVLLVAFSSAWSIPAKAQDNGVAAYARQSQAADKKAAKQWRKAQKSAVKKQRKAMKKYAKAQRKAVKSGNRRGK